MKRAGLVRRRAFHSSRIDSFVILGIISRSHSEIELIGYNRFMIMLV